jgi:hypothetical protein
VMHHRPEHLFAYVPLVADLPIPEFVENRLRSIAMLPPEAQALNRCATQLRNGA